MPQNDLVNTLRWLAPLQPSAAFHATLRRAADALEAQAARIAELEATQRRLLSDLQAHKDALAQGEHKA